MEILRVFAISAVVGLLISVIIHVMTPCPDCSPQKPKIWEQPRQPKARVADAAELDAFLDDDFD